MTTVLSEIAMTRVATTEDLHNLNNELTIRICGAVAVMLGLTIAIIKLT